MRAAWLVSSRYVGILNTEQRIEEATHRFSFALANAAQESSDILKNANALVSHRWVRALQFESLPAVDAVEALIEARDNGESISAVNTRGLTRSVFLGLTGGGNEPNPGDVEELERELEKRFELDELADCAKWLASIHYGCNSEPRCAKRGHAPGQMLYAIGRIYELNGSQEYARQYYQGARQISGGRGWWDRFVEAGLDRLSGGP